MTLHLEKANPRYKVSGIVKGDPKRRMSVQRGWEVGRNDENKRKTRKRMLRFGD